MVGRHTTRGEAVRRPQRLRGDQRWTVSSRPSLEGDANPCPFSARRHRRPSCRVPRRTGWRLARISPRPRPPRVVGSHRRRSSLRPTHTVDPRRNLRRVPRAKDHRRRSRCCSSSTQSPHSRRESERATDQTERVGSSRRQRPSPVEQTRTSSGVPALACPQRPTLRRGCRGVPERDEGSARCAAHRAVATGVSRKQFRASRRCPGSSTARRGVIATTS